MVEPTGSALLEIVIEPDTVTSAGSSVANVRLALWKSTPQTCSCDTSVMVRSDDAYLRKKR